MERRDLVKAANQNFSMPHLLQQMGCRIFKVPQTMRCPFHDDSKQSAKLFEDGHLYCFAEHRQFGPYDVLRALGFNDAQIRKALLDKGVSVDLSPKKLAPLDREKVSELQALLREGKISYAAFLERAYGLI